MESQANFKSDYTHVNQIKKNPMESWTYTTSGLTPLTIFIKIKLCNIIKLLKRLTNNDKNNNNIT